MVRFRIRSGESVINWSNDSGSLILNYESADPDPNEISELLLPYFINDSKKFSKKGIYLKKLTIYYYLIQIRKKKFTDPEHWQGPSL